MTKVIEFDIECIDGKAPFAWPSIVKMRNAELRSGDFSLMLRPDVRVLSNRHVSGEHALPADTSVFSKLCTHTHTHSAHTWSLHVDIRFELCCPDNNPNILERRDSLACRTEC